MSHWESFFRTVVVSSSFAASAVFPVTPALAQTSLEQDVDFPETRVQAEESISMGNQREEALQPAVTDSKEDGASEEITIPDFYPSGAIATSPDSVEPGSIETAREAALLELMTALSADTQIADTQLAEAPKAPGAEALAGLTSASLETELLTGIPMEAGANLAEIASSFQVDPSSVPALRTALNSQNPLTQLYAADTLWSLTGDVDLILPTLMSVAASGETQPRELAMLALAQLGEEGAPAVPVLDEIINNSDSRTDDRTLRIAQDALELVNSENRPATVLGILAREAGRLGRIPNVLRAISGLWR